MYWVRMSGNSLQEIPYSFQWADESFPICPNHGKPAAFRTVMKEGPNNGRKFFACPLPKQKQCGYFEWAEGF